MRKVTLDVQKKDKNEERKLGQLANLTESVKILLHTPNETPEKKFAVADQILDESLQLSGAPTDRESVLVTEVDNLLSTQDKNEAQIKSLTDTNNQIISEEKKDKAVISQDAVTIAKTTSTLYQVATINSSLLDGDNKVKDYCIWALIAVAVFIGLRIFLSCTTLGATIAAKIP